jgi:hypothetical protein
MNITKLFPICSLVGACLLAIAPKASAILTDYTVSSLSLPASGSPSINVNAGATAPLSFALDDGQSYEFVFFTLSPVEFPIGGNSFWNFSSGIDFSDPEIPALAFDGTFDEGSFSGPLSFAQPNQSINLPGDRSFAVDLITSGNEVNFSVITVTARVTQTSSVAPPSSVPDAGSTAALLGLGILALAFASRVKQTAHRVEL